MKEEIPDTPERICQRIIWGGYDEELHRLVELQLHKDSAVRACAEGRIRQIKKKSLPVNGSLKPSDDDYIDFKSWD